MRVSEELSDQLVCKGTAFSDIRNNSIGQLRRTVKIPLRTKTANSNNFKLKHSKNKYSVNIRGLKFTLYINHPCNIYKSQAKMIHDESEYDS